MAQRSPRHHQNYRRIISRVCIFLLLGAMVTVAVAWGCALRNSDWPTGKVKRPVARPKPFILGGPGRGDYVPWPEFPGWMEPAGTFMGKMMIQRVEENTGSYIKQFSIIDNYSGSYRNGVANLFHEERAGWPMLALQFHGQVLSQNPSQLVNSRVTTTWRKALPIPRSLIQRDAPYYGGPKYQRPLPIGPIWFGFVINTLFYAMILWALFTVPFALRKEVRRRRGLCSQCAYPIGSSDICTECGHTIPRLLSKSNDKDQTSAVS